MKRAVFVRSNKVLQVTPVNVANIRGAYILFLLE
jgi:hypothetical protein